MILSMTDFRIVYYIIVNCFLLSCFAKEWTIDELTSQSFPYLSSNDLYLDLNKAGKFCYIMFFGEFGSFSFKNLTVILISSDICTTLNPHIHFFNKIHWQILASIHD